ncbi:NADH-quinone oxidoreductase subunit A [Stetteria hydrogenophila]
MLELGAVLQSPMVRALAAFVAVPLALLLLLLATVYVLRVILSPSREVAGLEPRREARYEAGNPEKGEARTRVSMQYLGYLIIFLAVEPAVILLALALAAPRGLVGRLGLLYTAIVLVYAPFLAYALREARRVERWTLD